MVKVIGIACAILFLGAQIVSSQSSSNASTSQVSDPAAASALNLSLQAMGLGNVKNIGSTQASITVTDTQGVTSSGTLTTQGITNVRMDSPDSIVVTNGFSATLQSGSDTPTNIPATSLGEIGITHIPVLSGLSNWASSGMILRYLGPETLGNFSVYHITYQQPVDTQWSGSTFIGACDIYIDMQTQFIDRLTYVVRSPANTSLAVVVTVDYRNYTAVSGLMVPFTVIYSIGSSVTATQTITNFQINVSTSDSQFLIP
jgi:hypothetical protein